MIPEHELRQMYHSEGMTQKEIAKVIGVSYATISIWMKKYGIESRMVSNSLSVYLSKPSRKELVKMYCNDGMSQLMIANILGVNRSNIRRWMIGYGIKSRMGTESHIGSSVKPSKKDIEKMYFDNNMSMYEIADDIGVSESAVSKWMKEYKIEPHDPSHYSGENNSRWEGGISSLPYCYKFNNKFKEAVRKRDDYTCQLCGSEQNGRKLDVHHVHYDKENCYPDVITLCRSCNSRVNGNRDYWEKYFEDLLIDRGLYCWSLSQET